MFYFVMFYPLFHNLQTGENYFHGVNEYTATQFKSNRGEWKMTRQLFWDFAPPPPLLLRSQTNKTKYMYVFQS